MLIFGRQSGHGLRIDIRRIGENEIVAALAERREEIALKQFDPRLEIGFLHIAARHFNGIGRQIDGIDLRIGKSLRRQNGEAAGAGAQIQHAADIVGIADQGALAATEQAGEQKIADEGARHDHALVDIKGHAADIGFVEQIGRRLARRNTSIDQIDQTAPLLRQQPRIQKRIEIVDRQMQGLEENESGLVERIGRAMPIGEFGCVKTRDGEAQEIAQRQQAIRGVVIGGQRSSPAGNLYGDVPAGARWLASRLLCPSQQAG